MLTTWGVALFFVIDFWPLLSQLTPSQAILGILGTAIILLVGLVLWAGRIVTLKQIIQFAAVMFFFVALAVLYSYVGMKLGLFIRDLLGLERMSAALS